MSSLVKQLAVPIAFTGIGLASAQAATNPLAMPQVGDHELRLLDPTLLELTRITTKEPDPAPVTDWNFVGANFAPALPAATQFVVKAGDSTIGVTAVGFKRRPPVCAPKIS